MHIEQVVRGRRLTHGTGRRIRMLAGLSMRELAEELGVNAPTLDRWERGKSNPRPIQAVRWLEAIERLRRALDDELVVG